MKKLLIAMIFTFSFANAQVAKTQIIINEVKGDVQTRSSHTPSWRPLTAGLAMVSGTFIRLNSPDSVVFIKYPDGGVLRLLGIGSFYIEEISVPRDNIYHSKILLFSGRWFYQGTKDFPSRFIVNTDITTSVIEKGSGGGFHYYGKNEFVLTEGRGLISYRQKDINAIVLDERQYVNFNIFDGFFTPKLITGEMLGQYMIFEESATQIQPDLF